MAYNDKTYLNIWDEPGSCNELSGTDGSMFKPNLTIADKVTTFEQISCRKYELRADPNESFVTENGLSMIKFKLHPDNFVRGSDNLCYCHKTEEYCYLGSGVINVKNCPWTEGHDVVVSRPYFMGNERLRERTRVPMPDPFHSEDYETRIYVEPVGLIKQSRFCRASTLNKTFPPKQETGITLKATKFIQINYLVKQVETIA